MYVANGDSISEFATNTIFSLFSKQAYNNIIDNEHFCHIHSVSTIHVQLLFIIYHIAGNSYRGTDGYTACTRSFLGK